MTAAKTASQRGRAARYKGAQWERDVANAIRPWFPDVRRSRDNGSSATSDTGDLADAGPGLFWSLKDDKKGDMGTPLILKAWQDEAVEKAGQRVPVIVQKRRGHADPLSAWCWLQLIALLEISCPDPPVAIWHPATWVRLEFRDALALMTGAGYARNPNLKEAA